MKPMLNLRRYPLVLVFLAAGSLAIILALLSVDLVRMTVANLDYLRRTGVMGIMDGGLRQLVELALKGSAGLLCYFGFKLCEAEVTRRYRNWLDRQGK